MHSKKYRPSFDEIYMDLAENLGLRSHCVKAKVGAVLTKDTRIISLGYNGPPAGTHNCDLEWPEQGQRIFAIMGAVNSSPQYP